MKSFRFLDDNDDDDLIEEGYNGASWIFARREYVDPYRYDIVHSDHYGIHSFLDNFPFGFIVSILSITGPNGRIHCDDSEYEDGWGFDITSDLIRIEWVRFRNQ